MKPELDKAVEAVAEAEPMAAAILPELIRLIVEAAAPILLAPYQERIKELEGQAEKARRLLVELEQSVDAGAGLIPTTVLEPRLNEIFAALSEYRDDPKVGEIRGFIVNVDCPIHGAPAVASVSDVKTNVEEDASHE